jgi:HEAT repeat protein
VSDPTARLQAVLALPREPSSAPALLAAVEDVSLDVARAALRRLVPLAGAVEIEALRERLLELDVGLVGDVATALCELGDVDAVRVAAAGLEAESPSRRQKAAIALRELHDPASRLTLVRAIDDGAAPVRRAAVEALGRLAPDPSSLTACRQALSDPDASVRAAAIRVLAASDPAAFATLRDLASDPAGPVRCALASAACVLEAETAMVLLHDPDEDVRVAALGAFVGCPGAVPLQALLDRLGDASWHVRRGACDAVAAAGGEEAEAALVAALADRRLEVRGRALVGLERLCGDRLDVVLEHALPAAASRLRRTLVELLGRRAQTDAVFRHVGDPSPEVRITVAHALAAVRSPEALAALRFLQGDDDAAVRNAAAVGLAR